MTVFSEGFFMICFRREVCERTRLFTRKLLAETQDALDWTRSRPRLPRGAAAPALMNPAHSTCCSSRFCQESLRYFCLLSRDILARNRKEAQQRRPGKPVTTALSILTGQAPRSRLVPVPPPPLQPTPAPLAGHPSRDKHISVFLGCKRRLPTCTPIIPRAGMLHHGGWQRAHVQGRSRTSHCSATQHTPVPSTGWQYCTTYWVGYGLKKDARKRLFCQKTIRSGRYIYITYTHSYIYLCVSYLQINKCELKSIKT